MKKNKVKLSDVTTYKFGGTCNSYFEIDSEKQIQEFDFQNIDIDNSFVIGKGSNIVFSDNGYSGTILKPNMVTSGSNCNQQADIDEVARKTLDCLIANVPSELPGITFLSGGQSDILATAHLDAMNKIGGFEWKLSFSYGRALQAAALKAWGGKPENMFISQDALSHRAKMNKLASLGEWDQGLEDE